MLWTCIDVPQHTFVYTCGRFAFPIVYGTYVHKLQLHANNSAHTHANVHLSYASIDTHIHTYTLVLQLWGTRLLVASAEVWHVAKWRLSPCWRLSVVLLSNTHRHFISKMQHYPMYDYIHPCTIKLTAIITSAFTLLSPLKLPQSLQYYILTQPHSSSHSPHYSPSLSYPTHHPTHRV